MAPNLINVVKRKSDKIIRCVAKSVTKTASHKRVALTNKVCLVIVYNTLGNKSWFQTISAQNTLCVGDKRCSIRLLEAVRLG